MEKNENDRPRLVTSLFREQLLNLRLEDPVIPIAFHVFPAGMDVPEHTAPIEEETDTRPASRVTVQPPLLQRSPLRINRDRKLEAERLKEDHVDRLVRPQLSP